MKYIISILLVTFLAGCSFDTIPPTTKGKILTTSGYSPDILEPGKYTLWGRDTMILLETNTNTYKEAVKVILSDKLTLHVDIRFRGRIHGTESIINSMFNDVIPGKDNRVSFNEVYKIYGQMAVRNKTREIVSQYTVEDVHKNYSRISKEIAVSLVDALKSTPLQISDVALGNVTYPSVVTQAIDAAKERELAIKKEEAQAAIDLTKKKNERLLAEADYQIKITRAKAVRDSNKIIGTGITKELLALRNLEVQELMAEAMKANGNSTVFMPYEAMTSIGGQVKMFSK